MRSSSVETYEIATAPLRKCMAGVAGTPVMDSPTARVSTSLPPSVTRTIAAFRWDFFITSSMMRSTASAFAVSVADVAGGGGLTAGPQAVTRTSALIAAHTRTAKIMPDLGRRRRPDVAFPWHAGWDMNDVTVLVFSLLVFLVELGSPVVSKSLAVAAARGWRSGSDRLVPHRGGTR